MTDHVLGAGVKSSGISLSNTAMAVLPRGAEKIPDRGTAPAENQAPQREGRQ